MELPDKELQELKDKKISIEDLYEKYFYTQKDKINVENILQLLTENICNFKEIVDKFKSMKDEDDYPCLYVLLENKKLFEELIENNRLTQEDLEYLLNTIDKWYDLDTLCENTSLIKHILNEFILDKETADRLNRIIKKDSWCKSENVHTVFDLIEYDNEDNEEISKLIELNKKVYLLNIFELNVDQKLELIEVLRDNEIARNRLIQLIENNLEDQYNFEQLTRILTKDTEKKKIKLNF